ncbi:hypothetical protein GALL_363420 [mine drainage metagenome]|uniref:Uncharacterized protein n=1 Tax=mine drainage metagenome TaxID=410659 RepID=A0A1J5QWM6_9ZZZZ
MAHQQHNVLAPFAQRRQAQADDVEAMEQVLAELPLLHPLLQVLVGGGDDADMRLDRVVATHAIEVSIGQHAQQPGLQLVRHIADFVEKQRAALGLLEAPAPGRLRAGEGAALMAEQFALQQVSRNGCGVDGDERTVRARAVAVQCLRHQFLAGA